MAGEDRIRSSSLSQSELATIKSTARSRPWICDRNSSGGVCKATRRLSLIPKPGFRASRLRCPFIVTNADPPNCAVLIFASPISPGCLPSGIPFVAATADPGVTPRFNAPFFYRVRNTHGAVSKCKSAKGNLRSRVEVLRGLSPSEGRNYQAFFADQALSDAIGFRYGDDVHPLSPDGSSRQLLLPGLRVAATGVSSGDG